MAAYKYSTIQNDAFIAFKPASDTLTFDVNSINAADLSITESGADLIFVDGINFKTFTLQNTALAQLANVTFSSGSKLLVGDNTTGTANDNGDNLLTGGAKADLLYGMGGNDSLNGGAEADVLIGGSGNDTYLVDNVDDSVNETSSALTEIDSVQSIVSYALAPNVENLRLYIGNTIGTTAINGIGNALGNIIEGNNGSNILDGGIGKDLLIGRNGNDTYIVDSSLDVVRETTAAGGTDTVKSSISYVLDAHVEKLILIGLPVTTTISNINGVGNRLSNFMTGNDFNNILDGRKGADGFDGGKGNDIYIVDNTGDVVSETTVAANQIGIAKLQQSQFSYNPLDFADIDMIKSTVSYTLPNNIEQLQLLGSGSINATGNALNNVFYANVGNNTFNGVSGDDTVSYQPFSSTIPAPNTLLQSPVVTTTAAANTITTILDNAALAGVVASLAVTTAQNTKGAGIDTLKNIDNLIGSQYNDTLTGNSSNNLLDGGAGADVLTGGNGNDTYVVDGGDVVVEQNTALTQIDTVLSSASYVLSANVENLTLLGSTNPINGTGNKLKNTLIGNAAANTLDGSGGADILKGGVGDDRYVVDSFDTVFEDASSGTDTIVAPGIGFTLPSNVENLQLLGSMTLKGTGNELSNTIYANIGNSILGGGTNNPSTNVDTVSYEFGANAGVTADLGFGSTAQNTGGSGSDTLVGFTNVIGSGYDDVLSGTAAANIINGSDGSDTVSYSSDSQSSVVVNLSSVVVTIGASSISANTAVPFAANNTAGFTDTLVSIENATGTAKDDTFIVNALDNSIDGGAGNDTVSYEASSTSVVVDLNIITEQVPAPSFYLGYDTLKNVESLIGSKFADTLIGNSGNNVLRGANGKVTDGDAADTITGGGGIDTLIGDVGADILTGGAAKDTFRYTKASDSTKTLMDIITDFSKADGDKIDLSPLSPDTDPSKVFDFKGEATGLTAGQVGYHFDGANTVIEGVASDGSFSIQLTGNIALAATDFVL